MGNVVNHPQTDSVLFIQPNGETKIVVTETRIINVKPALDGGIEGTYAEIPTTCVVVNDFEMKDQLEDLLGSVVKNKQVYSLKNTLGATYERPVVQMLIDAYKDVQYVPTVAGVEAENIEQKSYAVKKTATVHGAGSGTDKKKEETPTTTKQRPTSLLKKKVISETSLETTTTNTTSRRYPIDYDYLETGELDEDWVQFYDQMTQEEQHTADLWLTSFTEDEEYTIEERWEWADYIKQNIIEGI